MTTEHRENHHLPPPPEAVSISDDVQDFSLLDLKPTFEEVAETMEGDDEEDDDECQFAFAVRDSDGLSPSITADELFSSGRLLPAYPIFNRDLLLSSDADASTETVKVENRVNFRRTITGSGSSSSEAPAAVFAAAEEVVVGEYCEWSPRSAPQSPELWKKSASTGTGSSSSHRWRLLDLVVGRSHSDGKEKFAFLAPTPRPRAPSKEKTAAAAGKGGKQKSAKMDMVTAHRLYYGKSGAAGGRRSFLPYRQELLGGLFTHANGLSWPHNRY